jgi:5-methylcytosine-specific restriction endonuclease McrA
MRRNSGRPWRRVRDQVYAEELYCWRCGLPVDQFLPSNHDYGRSVDHLLPASMGGGDDRANLRLAHRICNSRGRHAGPGVAVNADPAPRVSGQRSSPTQRATDPAPRPRTAW